MSTVPALTLALLLVAVVPAASAGDRLLRHEVVVDAPPAEVWKLFATEEGLRAWAAPFVRVDLRIGGTIESSYDADATPGAPGNIVQRILAYEPEVMLAAKTENAPAFSEGVAGVWGVTRLEPLAGGRTRVVGTMLGWGEGDEVDRAYAFFDRANPMVYESLKAHFAAPGPDASATMTALRATIGTWVGEREVAGFTSRTVTFVSAGPHEDSLLIETFSGGDRLAPTTTALVWIDPGEAVVRSMAVMGGGLAVPVVARDVVRLGADGETIDWSGRLVGEDHESTYTGSMHVRRAPDERMTLSMTAGEEVSTQELRRVDALPEAFEQFLDRRGR